MPVRSRELYNATCRFYADSPAFILTRSRRLYNVTCRFHAGPEQVDSILIWCRFYADSSAFILFRSRGWLCVFSVAFPVLRADRLVFQNHDLYFGVSKNRIIFSDCQLVFSGLCRLKKMNCKNDEKQLSLFRYLDFIFI